ncbi:O-methyltransferase family protein [C1] [Richelia intracellularis]|nr:O-methyltransferase family protein [C1] [Richelia intracellularis]
MSKFEFGIAAMCGVAESGDDFTKFSTISQWFQKLIHPALMQRPMC